MDLGLTAVQLTVSYRQMTVEGGVERMNALEAYADPVVVRTSEPVRLARLMALTTSEGFDDVALARRVADGLPTSVVREFAGLLGRSRIIGPVVPEATFRRLERRGKPLPREHSERIYELGRVIDAVGRAFHGDVERIDGFLDRPHPLLDGATPWDMARSCSAGAHAVLHLLRRAEAGVAV